MIWFCCGAVSSTCALTFTAVPFPRLEDIDEEAPAGEWRKIVSCAQPETPTESMEFLARSWSVSATELSRALLTNTAAVHQTAMNNDVVGPQRLSVSSLKSVGSTVSTESVSRSGQNDGNNGTNAAPRESSEVKELYLLHQALNSDLLNNQQILRNGLYKSIVRGKPMGRSWMKDQKERKKQENRAHNAQLHAAVSVAGVAAAVAAVAASTVEESHKVPFKASSALASAAALVASHCIDLAEEMGADQGQISAMVSSAINARSNGNIMALTAGAATALRGASTLRARLQKGYGSPPVGHADDKVEAEKEHFISNALDFVSRGGQLLKRTRKGDLHWKQVSFNISSHFQVVAKLKSKCMVGTFTKKQKLVVSGIYCDVQPWQGRSSKEEVEGDGKAYFGIKTAERVIEFECGSKGERQMWTEGIKQMMNYCSKIT